MASSIIPSVNDKPDNDPETPKANAPRPAQTASSSMHLPSGNAETSYSTLEPYIPNPRGRGRGAYRGRNSPKKPHQTYKEHLPLPNINTSNFKKFHVMKPMDDINLWKTVDTIAANKELVKYLKGNPIRVTELKNGSLLIEVANSDQANKIKQIKRLNNVNVTVIPHSSLNYTKGTIRCKRFIEIPDETLIEEMKEESVIDVYKIKRKERGELVCTGTIILTFDRCNLPSHIKIGWKRYEVREYVPAPRRCFKCQGFNHSSKACHSTESICVNCGDAQHGAECHSPPHCYNCDEAHPASDKSCFYYKLELEILSTKTKEKLSYGEAKRNVLKRYVAPSTSYAQALKTDSLISRGSSSSIGTHQHHASRPQTRIRASNFKQSTSTAIQTPAAATNLVVPNNQLTTQPEKATKSSASNNSEPTRQPTTVTNIIPSSSSRLTAQPAIATNLISSNSSKPIAHVVTTNTVASNNSKPVTQPQVSSPVTSNYSNNSLRNISTIITSVSDRIEEPNNRKRSSVDHGNESKINQLKVAKVAVGNTQTGGSGAGVQSLEPHAGHQQARSSHTVGGATSSASEGTTSRQGEGMEVEYNYPTPSPIIKTNKPQHRNHSSSRDTRDRSRDRRTT